MPLFIGIDPGIANGAIAIIDENKNILYNANLSTTDKIVKGSSAKDIDRKIKNTGIKVRKKVSKKKTELDIHALKDTVSSYDIGTITVIIEKVHAMNTAGQKQGISSSGRFMKACGLLEGLFIGMGIKVELVSPQTWKKHFGLIKKEKEDSIKLAEEIFNVKFKYKYQHNMAESLLIAYYGMG